MNLRSGVALWVIVIAIAAGGAAVSQFPKFPNLFHHKTPPTTELVEAQKARDEALARLKVIEEQKELEKQEAEKNKLAQLQYAQENVVAAQNTLGRVPDTQKTDELRLASQFVDRGAVGLSAAIGDLPPDRQKAILEVIDKALSGVQKERDEAQAALKQKDEELKVATVARQIAEAKIPVLQTQADTLQKTVQTKDAEIETKTAEVVKWANAKIESDKEKGIFSDLASFLKKCLFWVIGIYVGIHFILPSLVQEFPAFAILGKFYRAITSLFSAHYVDIPDKTSQS